MQILFTTLTWVFRNATPENGWEKFFPYLPKFVLLDNHSVVAGYYQGGSTMYDWGVILAWGRPMLWWGSFIFVLVGSLFLINTLLRKQWTENEKLSYPVIQIPLLVTTQTRRLFSTSVTRAAPREAHSKPRMPLPANRSRQCHPVRSCPSQLNRVSRTRSGVGRKPCTSMTWTSRLRQAPPVMRILLNRPPRSG